MFFLWHYTQINPKFNPCETNFVIKGAVYNALRLMWAIGIGSFVILTSNYINNEEKTFIHLVGFMPFCMQ